MVALPTPCAVTVPLLLTVSILGFDVVQLIFWCVAFAGTTALESVSCVPFLPFASTVNADCWSGLNELILTDATGITLVTI